MSKSIFESKLKPQQLENLSQLVTTLAWRLNRQDSRPADDAVLERIEAQKTLLSIRAFLNRFGILPSMNQDRLRMCLFQWFEERYTCEEIQVMFDDLEANLARNSKPILDPWQGNAPTIPWKDTAKGYGFDLAVSIEKCSS